MAKKNVFDHDAQDRKFVMLIYEDSETYVWHEVLQRVTEYADQWSYIRHDRDVESVLEDGQEKQKKVKPHYHVCMRFKNPRIRSVVANNLGIEKNYIDRAKNWKSANQYLIHMNDDDKFQYPWFDVSSNFDFSDLIDRKESETEKVTQLMDFIIREECTSVVKLGNFRPRTFVMGCLSA